MQSAGGSRWRRRVAETVLPAVLLLHDGLAWAHALELIDGGGCPALGRLIETGASGALAASEPLGPVPAAVTLACGAEPAKHGVVGERVGVGDGVVIPPDRSMLRAEPLWEVAARAGYAAGAVGWPVSRGSEATAAVVVADDVARPYGLRFDAWPMLPGVCNQADLEPTLHDLRVHPADIDDAQVAELVGGRVDAGEPLATGVRVALAALTTVHSITTYLLEVRRPTLLAMRTAFCADIAALIARHAERLETLGLSGAAVLGRAYGFLDLTLARILTLLDAGTCALVAPPELSEDDGTVRDGGFVIAGSAIKADALITGARLIDLAPTLLAPLGIAAPAMAGTVLADVFAAPLPPVRPLPAVEPWTPRFDVAATCAALARAAASRSAS